MPHLISIAKNIYGPQHIGSAERNVRSDTYRLIFFRPFSVLARFTEYGAGIEPGQDLLKVANDVVSISASSTMTEPFWGEGLSPFSNR